MELPKHRRLVANHKVCQWAPVPSWEFASECNHSYFFRPLSAGGVCDRNNIHRVSGKERHVFQVLPAQEMADKKISLEWRSPRAVSRRVNGCPTDLEKTHR